MGKRAISILTRDDLKRRHVAFGVEQCLFLFFMHFNATGGTII